MRFVAFCVVLAAALPARADPRIQKLLERLAHEAETFQHTASDLVSEESLRQRAEKVERHHFRPRIDPGGPQWQTREILSAYAFASVGDPPAIREIRKVISVDGVPVAAGERGLSDLLRGVQAGSDASRKRLLEDFEKHGLIGTVTDFGQLLLLFDRADQEHYQFSFGGERLLGAERCSIFAYAQHDGPGSLTIWEGKAHVQSRASGEIWVSSDNYDILRVTIKAIRGEAASAVRDEAEVDYVMSSFGVHVPVSITHREYRHGELIAENLFTYTPFRRLSKLVQP